jgi:hypothetical protein
MGWPFWCVDDSNTRIRTSHSGADSPPRRAASSGSDSGGRSRPVGPRVPVVVCSW